MSERVVRSECSAFRVQSSEFRVSQWLIRQFTSVRKRVLIRGTLYMLEGDWPSGGVQCFHRIKLNAY